ncbi:MAG TPA: HutD family protein [Candidatus Saccharimonadia bacterium]|nr:HutD family protein [Candidatus Saccharimonadia bacterium]
MRLTHLRRVDYHRMRWKNGLGWTSEIAISPAGAAFADDAYEWRLSIAELEADSDFSALPGIDRTIALVEGAGMLLTSSAGETVLERRGMLHAFAGEIAVQCRLIGGACRDFNVMTRRGRIAQRVLFRPLVGPMVFFAEPGVTWALYVVGGEARVQNAAGPLAVAQGETLLLESDEAPLRQTVVDGGGEVLLARLERIPAAG